MALSRMGGFGGVVGVSAALALGSAVVLGGGVALGAVQDGGEAGAAASYSFVPALEVGATMTYRAEWTASVEQSVVGGERSSSQRLTSDAVIRFEVEEVGPEGRAVVSAKVERVLFNRRGVDDSRGYRLPRAAGVEDEAGSAWENLGVVLGEAAIRFTVDATGSVGNVRGLDGFLTAAREASPDVDLTGMFSASQFVGTVEPLFMADGARGESRAMGSAWSTGETVALGAAGVMDISHDWNFLMVQDGVATLVGVPTITLRRPTDPAADTPTVALGEHTGYTRLGWDVESDRLRARESMLRLTTTWGVGDVSVEQSQTTQTKLILMGG